MLADFLCALGRLLLRLRYRITISGLDAVRLKGCRTVLFLPNHPALIDPFILRATLQPGFAPHALADRDTINRPVLRQLTRLLGVIPILDTSRYGQEALGAVEEAMTRCTGCLNAGENLMFYPAGRIYRSKFEDLAGKSGVERILREVPNVRVVLIRTRGLWGSGFGFGLTQGYPQLGKHILRCFGAVFANFIFFVPRRAVTIEFVETSELPSGGDRDAVTHFLETFYNQDSLPNTFVPYYWWDRGGTRPAPEPKHVVAAGNLADVPGTVRELVVKHLAELTGKPAAAIADDAKLARDLGLDSLAVVDLATYVQKDFGFTTETAGNWLTVGDVLLAACGVSVGQSGIELNPVPESWFAAEHGRDAHATALAIPPGDTLTEVFLHQARRGAGRVVLADQAGGVRTYRDVITAIFLMRAEIAKIPGTHIGIMLPASPGASILLMAALFAGKTPVMVNWTVGARNMAHSLDLLDVRCVLTAKALLVKIRSQVEGLDALEARFVMLEDWAPRFTLPCKLGAALRARLGLWGALRNSSPPETAAVLFTSGSESLPKAVPLTHANLLANLRDVVGKVVHFRADDRLLGILPPFHSFGLTGTTLLPLCSGLPVVYHANPTEGGMLARLIAAYRTTILVGTPTFLGGIVRAAAEEQLTSLRLVVAGAEKCPPQLYDTLARRFPKLKVLEGYGITECSPVISANFEDDPHPGTVGRIMPSLEWAVKDTATGGRAASGIPGLLLVRGPSVFGGYLKYDGAPPFIEFEGKNWYNTTDLVSAAPDGVLTFAGRLKRFIKLGGEMVSLPAVEEVLARNYAKETDDGPVVAVEATPVELNPELVLFTTLELDRDAVNTCIREGGLSPIHNIRRIVKLEKIPVLGTGKTDYRSLKDTLKTAPV